MSKAWPLSRRMLHYMYIRDPCSAKVTMATQICCSYELSDWTKWVDSIIRWWYCNPDKNLKVYTAQLCRHLQGKVPLPEQCIILGNFNDNLMSGTNSDLLHRMRSIGFQQHIQVTTDHGTLLDHVYSHNIHVTEYQVYDTYINYHDMTALHIESWKYVHF